MIGGPPPGSRKKIFFFCGTPTEKASREGQRFRKTEVAESPIPSHTDVVADHAQRTNCSSCTWESVHVSTIRHVAYYCECRLVGGISIRPNPGEWFLCCTADRDAFSPPRVVRKVARRQSSSLPCQHCINPPPNTLPLNGARGLRVHRRLAAELGKKIN